MKYFFFLAFGFIAQQGHCQEYDSLFPPEYNFGDGNNYFQEDYGTFGNEYDYNGSGYDSSGEEEPRTGGTYAITIKIKYKPAFQDDTSQKFERIAGSITRDLSAYLTTEMTATREDFDIRILSFEAEPGSRSRRTRATVDIEIQPSAGKTSEQLTEAMLRFVDTGRIGGKRVTDVTEIILDLNEPPDATLGPPAVDEGLPGAPVDYDVVITYERPFNPKLIDVTSSAFQKEKRAVEGEVNLFLVAGETISPQDLIDVSVNEFQPMNGDFTGAFMTVSLTNTAPQQLDSALQELVGETLRRRRIATAELNGLPTSSTIIATTTTELTPPPPGSGDLNAAEPVPPDASSPPNRGDNVEPTPPVLTDEPTPPPLVPDRCPGPDFSPFLLMSCEGGSNIGSVCNFSCPDSNKVLQGASSSTCQANGEWSDTFPTCENPGVFEFNKPSFVFKTSGNMGVVPVIRSGGTDGEVIVPWAIESLDKPSIFDGVKGSLEFQDGQVATNIEINLRGVASTTFVIALLPPQQGEELLGATKRANITIIGQTAGYCQPNIENEDIPNGRISCTDDNLYGSQCSVSCATNYRLAADVPVRECQINGEWTGSKQTCEIDSIDCEIEYDRWTHCTEGYRYRYGFIVQEAVGNGVPCVSPVPYKEEECQDCEIGWGDWGECTQGQRSRSEVVVVTPVGAGEPCPVLRTESETCIHCVTEWSEWSDCSTGQRRRTQEVAIEPVGAGAIKCLPLQTQTEECRDCVIGWGPWEVCVGGVRERHTFVSWTRIGAGKECPPTAEEREDCVHCQVEWEPWSECEGGQRSRSQAITTPPVGAGAACPELQRETEACQHCELEWGEWGECSDGDRTRTQFVSIEPVGAGNPCSEPETETEECVDCQIAWDDWSLCSRGQRSRSEVITVQPVGAGEPCPSIQAEVEPCVHCQLAWDAWSDCSNGERRRGQYIAVEAVGDGGIPCLPPQVQTEACIDCVVQWGEWSECHDYERERSMEVVVAPVGDGAQQCPHLDTESEDCYDCELAWDIWSDCENGTRTREQYILIEPEGGGKECEYEPNQIEACIDCVIKWGEWGDCQNGETVRHEEIVVPRVGAGTPCRLLGTERQDCRDCIVDWEDWSECADGLRSRKQFVVAEASEAGIPCPVLVTETKICIDCEVAWADWSTCFDGERVRFQYVSVRKEGAGKRCPELQRESEVCVHCEVEWQSWGNCSNGERSRSQIITVAPEGAGNACPVLESETEACVDCMLAWVDFGRCVNGEMTRQQYVVRRPVGAGRRCPPLQTETQDCADCVVNWGEWSDCVGGRRSRTQEVIIESVGTGRECPVNLITDAEACGDVDSNDTLCRYTREFLGYGGNRNRRDILLLGDESGSIGWINYEKIKNHFKAITHEIRGGVGSNHAQIAMMSFAGWTRTQFGFDTYNIPEDIVAAIGRSRYHGGHRSKIGQALTEANTWMFQQAEGMRSFPGKDDDDITHEILIATDGCRTSSGYFLQKGLKKIRRRGIKLSILGIDSHDPRCKEALREIQDGQTVLYEVGDWNALDTFNSRIENKECQP